LAIVWPVRSAKAASELLLITGEDVAVAILFGLLAAGVLRATSKRPRLHRVAWRTVLGVGAVAVLYAVISVGVYQYLYFPLNVRMLTLVKQVSHFQSSLAAHANVWVVLAALAAPVGYVLASRMQSLANVTRRVRVPLLAIGVAWAVAGTLARANAEPESRLARAGKNPHRELVGSFVEAKFMDRRIEFAATFPPEYMNDFVPAADRPRVPVAFASDVRAPRNVILVVLESVAAEHMSIYGSPVETTPNLAAEQQHAVVYERAYAHAGYTYLSRLPLLYGAYPGLPWGYLWKAERPLPMGLSRMLKEERGYRTAYFSGCELDWDRLDYTAQDAGHADLFGPDQVGGRRASSWGTEDGLLFDGLINWIDKDPAGSTAAADVRTPFFATIWTDQTHHPYTLTGPDGERDPDADHAKGSSPEELLHRYRLAIRQVDRHLGRLFEALRSRGIADDTLVVITGDHGEAFGGPHGLMGHGGGLYDENLRVPLVFWNPRLFHEKAPRRNARAAGHVDIFPSIAHLLGVSPAADWQGTSVFAADHPGRAYILDDMRGYQFGIVDERYKYIARVVDGVERLYDLHADPQELHDIAKANPAVVAERRGRIAAFIRAEEAFLAPRKSPPPATPPGREVPPVVAVQQVPPPRHAAH
jgi:arylsulfatase A-like enzyme